MCVFITDSLLGFEFLPFKIHQANHHGVSTGFVSPFETTLPIRISNSNEPGGHKHSTME